MNFSVVVAFFLAFSLLVGVDSSSVSLSNSQLTLNGHRFPIINSGDMITLRSSYPSGSYSTYWMYCHTSYCGYTTCKGQVMTPAAWSSCSANIYFYIHAMGKLNGQPINSGDTVSISSKNYGANYRLFCATSTSYKCRMLKTTSSLSGNNWFNYYHVTFQIFSRNAVDGTPVQYGDIVAFKYPYGFNSAWLYYTSSYFYPRSCSTNNKYSCAVQNTSTGFRIFKKL